MLKKWLLLGMGSSGAFSVMILSQTNLPKSVSPHSEESQKLGKPPREKDA